MNILSLFTSSGGHNFRCRGRIGTGSGSYKPPLLHVPTHRVSALGVESFEKRGVAIFGNENFYYFSSLGNKNWILFEPDLTIELNLDLFVCSFYLLV